jgi:prefoldin subunit 5
MDGLNPSISSPIDLAVGSSVDSSTLTDKLTQALETINRQQSTINEANATISSLEDINQELESDKVYLVDQLKYSTLLAHKLEKANGTISNLQSIIQELHSDVPQCDATIIEIDRLKDEIASLK